MVSTKEDGEDSAGRQKLKLQTPEELVDRAFDVAKLFMERARLEGLVHTTPDLPQPAGVLTVDDTGGKPLDTSS